MAVQEMVLLFNFQDKERKKQIITLLTALRLKVRTVPKQDYAKPVGALAGDFGGPRKADAAPVSDTLPVSDVLPAQDAYEGEELPGEMMLFAGLSGEQIDRVLVGFRKNGLARVDCKAVLTPVNRYWNAKELYEELKKEHEAFGRPT